MAAIPGFSSESMFEDFNELALSSGNQSYPSNEFDDILDNLSFEELSNASEKLRGGSSTKKSKTKESKKLYW